jgi:subtilisin family serine protease
VEPDELASFTDEEPPTGRYVVVFSDDVRGKEGALTGALRSVTGVSSVASSSDFADGAVDVEQVEDADATVFTELGVAVVTADQDRVASLTAVAAEDARIEAIEPELTMHALTQPSTVPLEYLRGFRDGASDLYERANGGNGAALADGTVVAPQFVDTPTFTWGLQATKVFTSTKSGLGVPVAILDTGFDLRHPDFVGRRIAATSFVPGQPVQDGHGHGTHVTGTSSGLLAATADTASPTATTSSWARCSATRAAGSTGTSWPGSTGPLPTAAGSSRCPWARTSGPCLRSTRSSAGGLWPQAA